jgi:hypothetical protein
MDATLRLGLLWLSTGCATGTGTVVEGSLQPRHFQFITVVEKTGPGPGGWREACVHVPIRRDTGEVFMCSLGVGMPIQTRGSEPLPLALAQRISADCANLSAQMSFSQTTPITSLGLACEGFRSTFTTALGGAVKGSRVSQMCHKATTPIRLGLALP